MNEGTKALFGVLPDGEYDDFMKYVDTVLPKMAHNVGHCVHCGKNTLFLHQNVVSHISCPSCGKALQLSLVAKE